MRFASCLLTLCILFVSPAVLTADEVLKPTKAYSAHLKAMRKVPRDQRAEEGRKRAIAYLEAWEATGQQVTGSQRYALAQFQQLAGQLEKAAAGFAAVQKDMSIKKDRTRDFGATAEANLLLDPGLREALGAKAVDDAVKRLTAYADAIPDGGRAKSRTKLRTLLARLHDASGRTKEAHTVRMLVIENDPSKVSSMARPIMRGLLASAHTMAGYDALRKEAAGVSKTLREAVGVATAKQKLDRAVAKLKASQPDALDADGNLKKTSTRGMTPDERQVYSAKRKLDSAQKLIRDLDEYERPLGMLGKEAPAWTLEKAFGEVKSLADLKGKVVVLEFWATWHEYSIRTFGTIRDLLKDYGDKGLVVVGLTASAHVCYESRFDLDEDMRAKATGGRLQYAARLASDKSPSDGVSILDEKPYRAREIEAISAFIDNHKMGWPVVLIDKTEADPKYALGGWLQCVVLDRKGRLRYFRSGSLSRDNKAGTAAFRKVLEALLAEPA